MSDALSPESPLTLPGFFDALSDGEFLGGVCADCGQVLLPPRPTCYGCGGRNVEIESHPRTGEVYTHTEVHTPPPALEDDAPYVIAVVEFDAGGRLTGRVEAEEIAIGDRVEMRVREPTEGERSLALKYELEWPVHVFEPL